MIEPSNFLLINKSENEHLVFSLAVKQAFPSVNCFFAYDCDHAINSVKYKLIPPPDFIFLNWFVPPYEPIMCLQQLKNATELQGIPIFGLSDQIPIAEKSWRESSGIKKVIEKQVNINLFSDAIFKAVYGIQ